MRAEIVAVGTELLLGQIVNTNAQYVAQQCAAAGIQVYYQTVVGDNEQRLIDVLEQASKRVDVVICTGGLGPTQDDLTKEALAKLTGRALSYHEQALEKIKHLFLSRGTEMAASNAKQAHVLEGCDPLWNDNGLAIGVGLTVDKTHYVLLPGPPKEMKQMLDFHAIPWLLSQRAEQQQLYSKMLKFVGIGESLLEHRLIDLIEQQSDPTIAPYAKEGETALRLTTVAASAEEAEAKRAAVETEIRRRLGDYLYAEEDITIEQAVAAIMMERKLTLGLAESLTGGLVSEMITAIPGSSAVLLGGFVCYTNAAKHAMVGVPMELLEGDGAPGAVSPETAIALVEGTLARTGADFALSLTGVAGPGTSEGKPVGIVYVGIGVKGQPATVETLQLSGNREMIRLRAAKQALYRLWLLLKAQ